MNEQTNENPWGRVDESNTVYVRDGGAERAVGQFPDGTPEEALAYFARKFDDLEGQVRLLEQRIVTGSATGDVSKSVSKLSEQLTEPAAVGDLASLRERVAKLQVKAEEFSAKQQAQRDAQKQEAAQQREAIVAEAEKIASQPEQQIRWKESSKAMEKLFTDWQEAQRQGPQISKSQADELWKRFRTARQTFDSARRRFFAQMDSTNKEVKEKKERLIARAEDLSSKGTAAITQYRELLEDWKLAGRASRKLDDQLWARFKAAGDVLFEAKAQEVAESNAEYEKNLAEKEGILADAEPILSITQHESARKQLTAIQLRWDEVGRVPRESLRAVEGRLKAIEAHVKKLEDQHWHATNPETIARSEGLRGQLEDSIAELQKELDDAKAAGDTKSQTTVEEKLRTQQSWLNALAD